MKYVAPFLLLLLTGCFETAPVRPVVPEKLTVQVPPEDLRPCDPLPPFPVKNLDQEELVDELNRWIGIHDVCSGRQARNVSTIRKGFNLPETPKN